MKASGIILAGGRSSRMGRDKALMLYNGETIIERTVQELRKAVDDIAIVVSNKLKYNISGVVEIPDIYPDMGPMGGMHAGLLQTKHQCAFVISCDMPLFSAKLARYLLERSSGYDVVVPKVKNNWEPLCAVYSKNCINPIEKCLRSGEKQVFQFYPEVRVLEVDQSEIRAIGKTEGLFYNMNMPDDYNSLLLRTAAEPYGALDRFSGNTMK